MRTGKLKQTTKTRARVKIVFPLESVNYVHVQSAKTAQEA